MRIGIDAHHLNGKHQGSRSHLIELIRALATLVTGDDDEDELHIFSFHPDETKRLVPGSHHRVFPHSAKIRLPLVVPALELAHGLDVFHSQYIAPPISFVPEVVTIHDVLFESHPDLFHGAFSKRSAALIRRSAERARAILTVSEFSRQAILDTYGVPEDRVHVTYNAVDHERFRPREAPLEELRKRYGLERPFVLSVGRLEPRKNLERLIRAFIHTELDATLVLVGASDFRYQTILDLARAQPEHKVRVLGEVVDDDLPGLYNLAEALAYPSLAEGFGMPVLEAMASGTPVLTTNRGALSEVAGDAPLYVDPEDEDAIRDGLLQIVTNKELQSRLRDRGLERARTFDWNETARRTLATYRQAL